MGYVCDDGGRDILDHYHRDKLSEYDEDDVKGIQTEEFDLVLVKDYLRESDQWQERSWAYVDKETWTMPEKFDNGDKVLKKYIEEFNRLKKKWNL